MQNHTFTKRSQSLHRSVITTCRKSLILRTCFLLSFHIPMTLTSVWVRVNWLAAGCNRCKTAYLKCSYFHSAVFFYEYQNTNSWRHFTFLLPSKMPFYRIYKSYQFAGLQNVLILFIMSKYAKYLHIVNHDNV